MVNSAVMLRGLGLLAANGALMLYSAFAFAAEPSAADRETSRALYAQGMQALDAHDYAGAERACGGARALTKVPTASACWGRALEGLGRLLEARDAFLEAARYPTKPDEPEVFATARQSSDQEAEALSKRIPTVTLAVSGPSESAPLRVTVDGAAVAPKTARLPRKVNPGAHIVVVSAAGFAPMSVNVDVAESEDRHLGVTLSLAKEATSDTPTPPRALTETEEPRSLGAPVWVAFGVGAAGLLVGSVAGAAGFASAGSAKSHCTGNACAPDAQGPINDAKTWATISDVGFVVAGVGAAVGAGLLLWGRPERAAPSASLSIGPGSVGVRGTW
jgi:hypothetical protein